MHNLSIDADLQQQEAASPQGVVVRSSSRYSARLCLRGAAVFLCTGVLTVGAIAATCEAAFEATRQGAVNATALLTTCIAASTTLSKDKVQALEYRAWLEFQKGNFSNASRDQAESLALAGSPSYNAQINQSLYLRRAGMIEASLKHARLAEEIERSSGTTSMMTQYHIGWSLLELGRHQEAISAFTAGIPFQPDFAAVYWLRARAYEQLGENKLARADYEVLARLLQSSKGREQMGRWNDEASSKLKALGIRRP